MRLGCLVWGIAVPSLGAECDTPLAPALLDRAVETVWSECEPCKAPQPRARPLECAKSVVKRLVRESLLPSAPPHRSACAEKVLESVARSSCGRHRDRVVCCLPRGRGNVACGLAPKRTGMTPAAICERDFGGTVGISPSCYDACPVGRICGAEDLTEERHTRATNAAIVTLGQHGYEHDASDPDYLGLMVQQARQELGCQLPITVGYDGSDD